MKILVLANNDVGLCKFRKELLSELVCPGRIVSDREAEKAEVYISLPDGEMVRPLEEIGCHFIDTPVDRRGINPITDFSLFLKYRRIISDIKPDLIITYTIKPNIYGGIAARMKKVPYVVNITGLGTAFEKENIIKKLVVKLYKTALKRVRVVLFENEDNRKTFIGANIVPEDKTYRLNGAGVNTNVFSLKEYPPEAKSLRFLFVGRIMKEKGIDEFYSAAKRIKSETPDIQFDVVGPYEDNYAEMTTGLSENGVINYFGFQPDVRPFIESCFCLCLPSYHEGMANTLLEAASMGRPLIASDIPGCCEALVDGESGFLCAAKDSDSLYDAMKRFIELDYEKKSEMGRQGRAHIEKNFGKADVVRNTIEQIEKK